uniref:Uncharacterized protein n=1 Tax=Fagus sylvatica TaxID=28930 RepID=A0A2N9ILB0_FAGSY
MLLSQPLPDNVVYDILTQLTVKSIIRFMWIGKLCFHQNTPESD